MPNTNPPVPGPVNANTVTTSSGDWGSSTTNLTYQGATALAMSTASAAAALATALNQVTGALTSRTPS